MLAAQRDDLGAGLAGLVGDSGLVIGVVERRADVVGHAAVNGHVLADAGQRLQDADGVQRKARGCHQAAAGLDRQARQLHTQALAVLADRVDGALGELVDGGRLVVGLVGDAQAAAHIELLDLVAVGFLHTGDELDHDLHGFSERMQREDLRADVAVEAGQAHVRGLERILDALEGEVVEHGEAELAVLAARADVLVRVGLDAGGDAHVDVLRDAQLAGDLADAAQLDAAVHHDAAHARRNGLAQLLRRLVVAVHEHALHGEARLLRAPKLAAAGHVEAQALLRDDARGFLIKERLGGEDDVGVLIAAAERLEVGFHAVAHVGLVHDVERGAFLMSKLHHIDAANEQVVVAHLGGHGQYGAQLHSGAVIRLLGVIRWCQRHRRARFLAVPGVKLQLAN